MAADMALAHAERRAAVLGCGVGRDSTAARQLQRRGFEVTIYAAYVPPDVTSNFSLAAWTPTSGLVDVRQAHAGLGARSSAQAAEIAYRQLQFMAWPKYGISWITQLLADRIGASRPAARTRCCRAHLQGEQTLLQPGEHPFPTTYAIERHRDCASSRTSTSTR